MGIVVISIVVLLRFILMHHCINEPKVYLEVTHIRVGGSSCARTHGDLETCVLSWAQARPLKGAHCLSPQKQQKA